MGCILPKEVIYTIEDLVINDPENCVNFFNLMLVNLRAYSLIMGKISAQLEEIKKDYWAPERGKIYKWPVGPVKFLIESHIYLLHDINVRFTIKFSFGYVTWRRDVFAGMTIMEFEYSLATPWPDFLHMVVGYIKKLLSWDVYLASNYGRIGPGFCLNSCMQIVPHVAEMECIESGAFLIIYRIKFRQKQKINWEVGRVVYNRVTNSFSDITGQTMTKKILVRRDVNGNYQTLLKSVAGLNNSD